MAKPKHPEIVETTGESVDAGEPVGPAERPKKRDKLRDALGGKHKGSETVKKIRDAERTAARTGLAVLDILANGTKGDFLRHALGLDKDGTE